MFCWSNGGALFPHEYFPLKLKTPLIKFMTNNLTPRITCLTCGDLSTTEGTRSTLRFVIIVLCMILRRKVRTKAVHWRELQSQNATVQSKRIEGWRFSFMEKFSALMEVQAPAEKNASCMLCFSKKREQVAMKISLILLERTNLLEKILPYNFGAHTIGDQLGTRLKKKILTELCNLGESPNPSNSGQRISLLLDVQLGLWLFLFPVASTSGKQKRKISLSMERKFSRIQEKWSLRTCVIHCSHLWEMSDKADGFVSTFTIGQTWIPKTLLAQCARSLYPRLWCRPLYRGGARTSITGSHPKNCHLNSEESRLPIFALRYAFLWLFFFFWKLHDCENNSWVQGSPVSATATVGALWKLGQKRGARICRKEYEWKEKCKIDASYARASEVQRLCQR